MNAWEGVDVKFRKSVKVHKCLFARFQSVSKGLFIIYFNQQVIGHEMIFNHRAAQLNKVDGQLTGLEIL